MYFTKNKKLPANSLIVGDVKNSYIRKGELNAAGKKF
jgi:hypothetical protein